MKNGDGPMYWAVAVFFAQNKNRQELFVLAFLETQLIKLSTKKYRSGQL